MRTEEQILLCHSLESGSFTEYLDRVKQLQHDFVLHRQRNGSAQGEPGGQEPLLPSILPLTPPPQPQPNHGNYVGDQETKDSLSLEQHLEHVSKLSDGATYELYESIKCVVKWMDSKPPPRTRTMRPALRKRVRRRRRRRVREPSLVVTDERRLSSPGEEDSDEDYFPLMDRHKQLNPTPRSTFLHDLSTSKDSVQEDEERSHKLVNGPLNTLVRVRESEANKKDKELLPKIQSGKKEGEYALPRCRIKESVNNYYLENCILDHHQPTDNHGLANFSAASYSFIPPFTTTTAEKTVSAAVSAVIAATTIASAAASTTTGIPPKISTTFAVPPELGGLFGNDSITDNSLTGLWSPTQTALESAVGGGPPTGALTYHWNFLFFVIIFIIAGGLGNILVCLAIALDRKLQNVTNYFLLSLAIADLLVSLFVMPLGAIPTFLGGHWPLGEHWCNVYVTCDVLACSASIWHMCFISLGRYLGIKNPLSSRHRATKRIVGIKIAVCWLMAMPVSSSIAILGSIDMQNIIPQQNVCTINNKQFFVYGSLVAFYIPMVIMVSTYALTVQLLRKKARFAAHPESEIFRSLMSHRLGGARYGKHSTGSSCASGSTDHVEVTNCRQQQRARRGDPPYLQGKVKSISETDLGRSMRRHQISSYDHQANASYQAPPLRRSSGRNPQKALLSSPTSPALIVSATRADSSAYLASETDTHKSQVRGCRRGQSQEAEEDEDDFSKLVLEKQHRKKHQGFGQGYGLSGNSSHSKATRSNGHGDNNLVSGSVARKKLFGSGLSSTCDQATQTSPKPLKRPTRASSSADMRGHKLKLNIQSVASPYLNFNLRLPKNRKRPTSLSANAVANEQKATKVLGIVFFTFVLCWAPFFVLNIVMVLYPRENIPDHVIDVCLWLGYVSSTINPIIYTIFNRTFRAAFIRLLRCNCQRSGRPYRYRSVTESKGAASLCARSALPLAISLQGTGLFGAAPPPQQQQQQSQQQKPQQQNQHTNTRNTNSTVTDSEC